eukprot:1231794-Pleurochrysis_carterae.AAC.2
MPFAPSWQEQAEGTALRSAHAHLDDGVESQAVGGVCVRTPSERERLRPQARCSPNLRRRDERTRRPRCGGTNHGGGGHCCLGEHEAAFGDGGAEGRAGVLCSTNCRGVQAASGGSQCHGMHQCLGQSVFSCAAHEAVGAGSGEAGSAHAAHAMRARCTCAQIGGAACLERDRQQGWSAAIGAAQHDTAPTLRGSFDPIVAEGSAEAMAADGVSLETFQVDEVGVDELAVAQLRRTQAAMAHALRTIRSVSPRSSPMPSPSSMRRVGRPHAGLSRYVGSDIYASDARSASEAARPAVLGVGDGFGLEDIEDGGVTGKRLD